MISGLFCLWHHRWETHQVTLRSITGIDFVLAWRQCRRCAKSKIVHVLR